MFNYEELTVSLKGLGTVAYSHFFYPIHKGDKKECQHLH